MLETERLHIIPLTHVQLLKYVNNDPALDAELNIAPIPRVFSSALSESIQHWIIPKTANPKNNFYYYTLWAMILKTERVAVGDLCFKYAPDAKGEVEIGYGTYEPYRKQGYMREALGAMLGWATAQKEVKAVTAEANIDNVDSLAVLASNGFRRLKEKNGVVRLQYPCKPAPWWRLRKA